ncbi:MAG: GWxTD domain-containing protein, partial [Acidobacteriota bacterium]|nr:GWxTD domain-containing protein [Acidobacteriota bacterium]
MSRFSRSLLHSIALVVFLAFFVLVAPSASGQTTAEQPASHQESKPDKPTNAAAAAEAPDTESAPDDDDAQPESPTPETQDPGTLQPMAQRFVDWLRNIEPLILREEKQAFLELRTDYQRDAFIRRFWQARDPYPETARNELRDRWERYVELARSLYGGLQDDRARILLVHGKPASAFAVRCTTTRSPVEVWIYRGTEQINVNIILIFFRERGTGPARLWQPGSFAGEQQFEVAKGCLNGDQMVQALNLIRRSPGEYDLKLRGMLSKPSPRSSEWLSTFESFSTELPPGAPTFEAKVEIDFLGRYQSRTVTQGVLKVPVEAVETAVLAGYESYDFTLTGEVVIDDSLFESFRYKFGFPADSVRSPVLPLAFQRYLRPGTYRILLKLEDTNQQAFFRYEAEMTVPQLEDTYELAVRVDPESAELFAEATAAVTEGETSIKIIQPRLDLLTGFTRFDTLALGDEIEKVVFLLNGQEVLTKNRPPYNVEIDLGPFPRLHELRVEAL